MNSIQVRKVAQLEDLHKVYQLAHDTFSQAGLCDPLPHGMMIHHPGQDVIPQTCIFIAEDQDKVVGSISFTLDSNWGLMVDPEFKTYIDRYRLFYGQVASIWRFIIHPDYRNDRQVFRKLIGAGALCLKKFKVPVCFFTFSPEHARIYEKIFHTEEVGRGIDSNEVIKPEHAEVVLMKLYPDKLPENWFSVTEAELQS